MSDRNYDLIIVGSGSAGAYTLKHLVQILQNTDSQVRIGVVEKSNEFYTGVAYGSRSGKDALTITKLKDFLPHEELSRYFSWCEEKNPIRPNLPVSEDLQNLQIDQQSTDTNVGNSLTYFEDLCTSRRHFGEYLASTTEESCRSAALSGRITVEKIHGEINDIQQSSEHGFVCNLVTELSENKIHAKEIVLAIGSGVLRQIPYQETTDDNTAQDLQTCVDNAVYYEPYEDNFDEAMRSLFLSCAVNDTSGKNTLLLVGANASALEVVFYCWMKWMVGELDFNIEMVSIAGELPEAQLSASDDKEIETMLLDDSSLKQLTANQLHSLSEEMLKEGKRMKLPLLAYSGTVNKQVFRALSLMSKEESVSFLRKYAVSLGGYQRKAENLYRNAADQLLAAGVLNIRAGRVRRTGSSVDSSSISVLFGDGKRSAKQYGGVVNCMGFEPISTGSGSALIRNLLKRGMVESHEGQSGFAVDNDFKTVSGIHVIGPLLSGNFVHGKPVWHMEHVGRIYEFSN
ncbi:FAD/NAD(P)-binding protein, partial [Granulosicoccus sp.]